MRRVCTFLLLALCMVAFSAGVNAQRKFPYCGTVESTVGEMHRGLARLAAGDKTFDIGAFQGEIAQLYRFRETLLPMRTAQCFWLVTVNMILPEWYDLRYYADILAAYRSTDWAGLSRIMSMAAYGQMELPDASDALAALLQRQLR